MSLVIRRVGGLEVAARGDKSCTGVIRRVGGLEVNAALMRAGVQVIRRVGGLEGCAWIAYGMTSLSAV